MNRNDLLKQPADAELSARTVHGRIRDQMILIASLIAGGDGVDEAERSLQDFERTQRHHLAEIERIKGALRLR